jgi:hypothetical protein
VLAFAICRKTAAPAVQQAGVASCDGDDVVALCMVR